MLRYKYPNYRGRKRGILVSMHVFVSDTSHRAGCVEKLRVYAPQLFKMPLSHLFGWATYCHFSVVTDITKGICSAYDDRNLIS